MNGEEPGKRFYIFEVKLATHQKDLKQCPKGDELLYQSTDPCLPRSKPARIQGYCVMNQKVRFDGAEHCPNDRNDQYEFDCSTRPHRDHHGGVSFGNRCSGPNRLASHNKAGWFQNEANEAPGRDLQTMTSLTCMKNRATEADWSKRVTGKTLPIVPAVVAETYMEELVFPYADYGQPSRHHKQPLTPTLTFRMQTNSKPLFVNTGKIGVPTQCNTNLKQITPRVANLFSAYPKACRRQRAGGCGTEFVPCCPYRHIYPKMEPVSVPLLRKVTTLDWQIGSFRSQVGKTWHTNRMRFHGGEPEMFKGCVTAQGEFVVSWWYKPVDASSECMVVPGQASDEPSTSAEDVEVMETSKVTAVRTVKKRRAQSSTWLGEAWGCAGKSFPSREAASSSCAVQPASVGNHHWKATTASWSCATKSTSRNASC